MSDSTLMFRKGPLLAFALGLALAAAPACAAGRAAVPDPTRPAVFIPAEGDAEADAEPAADRQLQSTLVSPRQRAAVIDGQRYAEGDRLGDARILSIQAGVVRLRGPEGDSELRLSFSPVTRPVSR